jgi:hypothetical protein
MKINLNRCKNIFEITRETPEDLIVFLMKTTGNTIERSKIEKKFEKIRDHLETYRDEIELKDDYDQEELSRISTFLSDSDESWRAENIIKCFRRLIDFNQNTLSLPDIRDVELGSMKEGETDKYDICMIYILCKRLSITTTRDDTIESMFSKLRRINDRKDDYFNLVKDKLRDLTSLQLYQLLNTAPDKKSYHFQERTFNKISELSKNININYIIRNSILTSEEAIVYGAKFFNYDITESDSPIDILRAITDKKDDSFSFPEGDRFSKNFKINQKYFKLDKFWKKNLESLYQPKTLTNLKNYENIEDGETLNERYSQDNFYDGIVNFGSSLTMESSHIVSFGRIEHQENIETMTIENLTEKFKKNLVLGKYEKNIEKLVNICREYNENCYTSLHKIIRFIQKYCSLTDENMRILTENAEDNKNILKEIISKLFEISELFKDKESIDDLDNISVMNSILNLNKYIHDIRDETLRERISKLPLVDYKEENFCKANENYYSYFYEDLSNIKNLKDKSPEYIASKFKFYRFTAYYYNYIFFKEHLFELDK